MSDYSFNGVALSEDQVDVVKTIDEEDGPFFMTGPAGSGKTFVINYLRKSCSGTIVCAMTGAAAQLLSSTTAHSVLGIIPRPNSVPILLNSFRAIERIQKCNLLIIDEISMADDVFLNLMFDRFDSAGTEPKLVVVGDMMQLPAVLCRDGNGRFLSKKLFYSDLWKSFKVLNLKQQHRQIDNAFLSALNDIRVGNLSEGAKTLLSPRIQGALPDDCVHLYPYRNSVTDENERRLQELPGEEFRAPTDRELVYKIPKGVRENTRREIERELEKLKLQSRYPELVRLKVGARVVLLSNKREPDGHQIWVNGSTGEVVELKKDYIYVKLDLNKNVVRVERERDEVFNADGDLVYVLHQFPIMLGWAMTIHKGQGQTFDRVGVDLNGHFECGQTYVALSRCRYLDGLFLTGNWPDQIKSDQEALKLAYSFD